MSLKYLLVPKVRKHWEHDGDMSERPRHDELEGKGFPLLTPGKMGASKQVRQQRLQPIE